MRKSRSIGYIYAVGVDGRVKIGTSKSPKKRVSTIKRQSGLGDNSLVIISPLSIDNEKKERLVHQCFLDHRVRGEWFDIEFTKAAESINAICKRESLSDLKRELRLKSLEEEESRALFSPISEAMIPDLDRMKETEDKLSSALVSSAVRWSELLEYPSYIDKIMLAKDSPMDLLLIESDIKTEIIKNLISELTGQ